LENWVHRELLMSDSSLIRTKRDLTSGEGGALDSPAMSSFSHAKAEAMRQFERDYVLAVMRQTRGNVTRAAQIAGKERRAFGKLLKKHEINRQALPD